MAAEIFPGPLTVQGAAALNQAVRQADETAETIARWPIDDLDELPVKLTAYDSTTGACSGTLQDYDSDGKRKDHWTGRLFTPTSSPLFPTGNGVMPPSGGFPVQVWARRRINRNLAAGAGDPVYEFDWVCACVSYYGAIGSGLGSAGMLGRDFCSGGIAASGTGTFSTPGCPVLNGQVINLNYSALFDWWEGSKVISGVLYEVILIVSSAGVQVNMFAGPVGSPTTGCTLITTGIPSCGPPFTISPVFRCAAGACPAEDLLFVISI